MHYFVSSFEINFIIPCTHANTYVCDFRTQSRRSKQSNLMAGIVYFVHFHGKMIRRAFVVSSESGCRLRHEILILIVTAVNEQQKQLRSNSLA